MGIARTCSRGSYIADRAKSALECLTRCDEVGKGEGANFTGAFVGMCCQDIAGTRQPADFHWFDYREGNP